MADHPPVIPAASAADPASLLFVVRLWWEPAGGAATGEWRGWVEHTATRERRYFRDGDALVAFIGRHVGWSARSAPPVTGQPTIGHTRSERSAAMPSTNGYAHPEVLVETQWVADHLHDPTIRLVEVDVDTTAYETGHHPRRRRLELATGHPAADPARHPRPRPSWRRCSAAPASATTRPSSSTATTTTGSPPTPTGCSSLRPRRRARHERRPQEVARRGPRD